MKAVVSIITPSFNRADIIHETAESIFNQTYPHWEWVITDDGSTDNSWEVLQQYAATDSRVKIFQRNREPKGACVCRNIAVKNSSGDYLLFLDTDDLLASFCLEQRVKAMQECQTCDFVIFPMLMFNRQPDDLKLLWNIDNGQDDIERILFGDPVCQGTGTLWKKNSFEQVGMWSEALMLWQDIELHLRSLLAGMKYEKRLDLKPDVFLRVSDISLSRTGYHSYPKFVSRLEVFQQTAERMEKQLLIKRYRKGLRYMFTDLYVNAANSNYKKELKLMMELQQRLHIFTETEQAKLNWYAWLRKTKLFKFPFFQTKALSAIQTTSPGKTSTLTKVVYEQAIVI